MKYIAKALLVGLSIVGIASIESRDIKAQYSYTPAPLNNNLMRHRQPSLTNFCARYGGLTYFTVYGGRRVGISCVIDKSGRQVKVVTLIGNNTISWKGKWHGKGGVISTDRKGMICYSDYWKTGKPGFCGFASDIMRYKHYYTR